MRHNWDITTHLLGWPKSKALTTPNASKSGEQSHSLLLGMQNGIATLEDRLAVSYKQNVLLPYNAAIVLLGIYPKELKWVNTHKPYTQCMSTQTIHTMFIKALFIIAKTGKQPRYSPSVGE